MTEATVATGVIPEWDLADRMRKSLRVSGIGVQDIADYLGVGRNTVSTWINGKIAPSKQTQRLWALRCGVSYEWLIAGGAGPTGTDREEGIRHITAKYGPPRYDQPWIALPEAA